MYIKNCDYTEITKNGDRIMITKGKGLSNLEIISRTKNKRFESSKYFEIKKNSLGVYIEICNTPFLHSLGLDNISLKRLESSKNAFILNKLN